MTIARPKTRARTFAAVVAFAALAALVLQYRVALTAAIRPEAVAVWWWLAGYFTILTNLWVAFVLGATTFGFRPSPRLQGGMVLSILMVGIVYHAILARLWAPQGLAWWADQGLHSAVPALTFGWWLCFGNKRVSWHDLPAWLVWPSVYSVYAVTRGAITGSWPYPFLDADHLGWAQVAANVAGMVLAFMALGLGLIGVARALVR